MTGAAHGPAHAAPKGAAADPQSGSALHLLRRELHRRITAAYQRMQCADSAAAMLKARETFDALALELARLAEIPALTSEPGFDGLAKREGV